MNFPITRNLEDGPDYQPDWRYQLVQEFLKAHAKAKEATSCEELLADEKDVLVRLVVRYHLTQECAAPEPVRYALAAQQSNRITGQATTIRAMALAGRNCGTIANYLKTTKLNIVVFTRLFWDIERYLEQPFWLESLIRHEGCRGNGSEHVRERRLLRVAYHKGWEGLREALLPRQSRSKADVKAVMVEIQHAVGVRALEFVEALQDEGVPTGQDDFQRHLMVSAIKSRDIDPDNDETKTWGDWLREAAEREFITPREAEIMFNPSPTEEADTSSRRERLLPAAASPPQRMDEEGAPGAGVEDCPEGAVDVAAVHQDKVEVTPC